MNQFLTTEQRIVKQRTQIMRDDRFIAIAGILLIGDWSVVDDMPTAATNGRDVFYGRKFIDEIDDATLRFVILHEYYHVMLMQLTVWKHLFKANSAIANIAADFVVNNMLDNQAGDKSDSFIKIHESACLDHQYDNLDTGEVFRRLLQASQGQQGQGQQGQGQQGQGQQGQGQQGQGQQGQGQQGQRGQGQGFDQHNFQESNSLSDKEVKELQTQIDSTLRQGAQIASKLGCKIDRSINDLLQVIVPWQEVLQDFVKTTCVGNDLATWRKPSRRWMMRDVYMPSHYSESVKRIIIGVDTSGSISSKQLCRALTEIKSACEVVHPEVVDVIYWDTEVTAHEIYEGDYVSNIVDATKPIGSGGTCVGSMLRYIKAQGIYPDAIIIFTDGYVEPSWGGNEWPAPVLWCVSTHRIAPFGKTLYVPVE